MKKHILLKSFVMVILFLVLLNINRIKFLFSFIDIYTKNIVMKRDISYFEDKHINPLEDLIKQKEVNSSLDSFNTTAKDDLKENINNENQNSQSVNENISIKKKSKLTPNKKAIIENSSKDINSIAIIYQESFESLQKDFMNSLNKLVESAYNEYTNGDISKSQLLSKYLDLGSELEKKSDEKFFLLLNEMKVELKENGHNINITKEIEAYYKNLKNLEKNELLNKLENKKKADSN